MWRSKKVIVIAVLAAILLFGTLGGIALANTGDDGDTQSTTTIFDRVAAILQQDENINVTSDQLKNAFVKAQGDLQLDALKARLDALVEEGKIEQSEADEYLEWWQARPEGMFGFGPRARGFFHGMGNRMRGFGGFGGPCIPQEPVE